jgi:hypothetical protein
MPASKGTGIIAGGPLRVILDLAGVKDAIAKSFGTGNKLVNAQASMLALRTLRGSKPAGPSENFVAGGSSKGPVADRSAKSLGIHIPEGPTLPIKEVKASAKDVKEMSRGPGG